ncbi:hypothetical protein C1645_802705 [Glomus cerebriforme]|uniref:Protein kinase domain-containing protein n=1 Tax=Glomus cerebriforme TaxID=658196 RepID=A0A397TCN9_9GLOM|nr:hypothetical protein C1645_802705 [Glomus cerebriforme]
MSSTSASASASTNVRQELNRLSLVESGITEDEFVGLLVYITNNPNRIPDLEESLKYCTDKLKVKYLRKLLVPEQPAVENLEKLFGQMDVSSSSGSVNTPSLSMFLKVVADNSEITRKNSETMVRFMKECFHDTYQNTVFERADVEYFLCVNNTFLGQFSAHGSVNAYLRDNPVPTNTEEDVQKWFNGLTEILPKFTKKLVVKDTHTNTYLNGLKPDISVFMEEDVINDVYNTMFVQTLLEVKKRKSMSGLSDEDKGQVLDYIRVLVQQQPLRMLFAVFLSDGFYFYVMAYDRKTKKYSEYTTNLREGLRLFWVLLNFGSPFTMMVGPKSIDIKTSSRNFRIRLKGYLGMGSSSTVYQIDWQNTPSAIKVFKGHSSLLHLLKRIHNMKIYHRDVRPENILLDTDNNKPILVDWESSIRNTKDENNTVEYEGTVTFASPNILDKEFGPYIPSASDDLHSFVRTIYILRNPSNMPTIPNENLSLKAQAVREYWSDKLDGRLWREMVDAASAKNYDLLEKCCDVFEK